METPVTGPVGFTESVAYLTETMERLTLENQEKYHDMKRDKEAKQMQTEKLGQMQYRINQLSNKIADKVNKTPLRTPRTPTLGGMMNSIKRNTEEIKAEIENNQSEEFLRDIQDLARDLTDIEMRFDNVNNMTAGEAKRFVDTIKEIKTVPQEIYNDPSITDKQRVYKFINYWNDQNEESKTYYKTEIEEQERKYRGKAKEALDTSTEEFKKKKRPEKIIITQ